MLKHKILVSIFNNPMMRFSKVYILDKVDLKKGSVLVHCGSGISRSATIVIAYYMRKNHETFKNAIKIIRKARPIICPNLGFELQLKKYDKQLFESQLPLKKNISEKFGDYNDKGRSNHTMENKSQIYNKNKFNEIKNSNVFNFNPNFQQKSQKNDKKGAVRHYAKTRPKQQTTSNFNKKYYESGQTDLFISGKGAIKNAQYIDTERKRQFKDGYDIKSNKAKNPLFGTWGAMNIKASKQFFP